jgi:hypothetical protein
MTARQGGKLLPILRCVLSWPRQDRSDSSGLAASTQALLIAQQRHSRPCWVNYAHNMAETDKANAHGSRAPPNETTAIAE